MSQKNEYKKVMGICEILFKSTRFTYTERKVFDICDYTHVNIADVVTPVKLWSNIGNQDATANLVPVLIDNRAIRLPIIKYKFKPVIFTWLIAL